MVNGFDIAFLSFFFFFLRNFGQPDFNDVDADLHAAAAGGH